MDDTKDAERLRLAQSESDTLATQRRGNSDSGALVIVGKTTNVGTYPTTVGGFYWVQMCAVFGAETEGAAGTVTTIGGKFLACHRGTTAPPVNSEVICIRVNHRWIFEY